MFGALAFVFGAVGAKAASVSPYRIINADDVGTVNQPGLLIEGTPLRPILGPVVSIENSQNSVNGTAIPDPIAVGTANGVAVVQANSADGGPISLDQAKLVIGPQGLTPNSMAGRSLDPVAKSDPILVTAYSAVRQVILINTKNLPEGTYNSSNCAQPVCALVTTKAKTDNRLGDYAVLINGYLFASAKTDCTFSTQQVGPNGSISILDLAGTMKSSSPVYAENALLCIPALKNETIAGLTMVPAAQGADRGSRDGFASTTGSTGDAAVKLHYVPNGPFTLDDRMNFHLELPSCENPTIQGGLVSNYGNATDQALLVNCGDVAYVVKLNGLTGLDVANNRFSVENPPVSLDGTQRVEVLKITGLKGSLTSVNSQTGMIMLRSADNRVTWLNLQKAEITFDKNGLATYKLGSNPNAEGSLVSQTALTDVGAFNGGNPVVCDTDKCYVPDLSKEGPVKSGSVSGSASASGSISASVSPSVSEGNGTSVGNSTSASEGKKGGISGLEIAVAAGLGGLAAIGSSAALVACCWARRNKNAYESELVRYADDRTSLLSNGPVVALSLVHFAQKLAAFAGVAENIVDGSRAEVQPLVGAVNAALDQVRANADWTPQQKVAALQKPVKDLHDMLNRQDDSYQFTVVLAAKTGNIPVMTPDIANLYVDSQYKITVNYGVN
jgi:hypothetical protein